MKSLLNALQEGRLLELPDSDKEKSLIYLAHLIEAIPDLSVGVDLVDAMLNRERSANTGLGHGVACPHVRASGTGEMLCAVGWNPAGIDYGASDGKKVHLVVMYYIPEAQKNVYLKEVSGLAGAVKKAGGIEPIASAKDLAAVRERLLDWVSAAIEAGIPEAKARMIRLEARQAVAEAAPLAVGTKSMLQIASVLILALGDAQNIVLSQNREAAAALEKMPDLRALLAQQAQFEAAGCKMVYQSSTQYDAGRTLYKYLAVRIPS